MEFSVTGSALNDPDVNPKRGGHSTLVSQHPTLLATVLALCAAPLLLNFFGADFNAQITTLAELRSHPAGFEALLTDRNLAFDIGNGALVHALLEWTAVMVAFLTAIVAFSHFLTDKDNNTTSIIGIALLVCGAMECFHTLASLRIFHHTRDHVDFIPFTWSLARTFNAGIFLVGAIICLRHINRKVRPGELHFDLKLMALVSAGFILLSFLLMKAAALVDDLPRTLYADALFKRPFEILPILLFALTVPYLLRLYNRSPNMLNATLVVSIIPHIVLELHMLLGSAKLFDNHFIVAHAMKILAYALPFYGLVHNYVHAYHSVNHALYHDSLTATANRNYFYMYADATISRAARENQKVAFFYMDLDGFKQINDLHGHEVGDTLLQEFAQRVKRCIRAEDCFARMGGDEFVVVVSNFEHVESLHGIAQKICDAMKAPVETDAGLLSVKVSIGISIFPDEPSLNKLVHNADLAMYQAKRDTSRQVRFFSRDMSDSHRNTLELQTDLESALENNEFTLVYQPVYESEREDPVGFEALLRWNHPVRGEILPGEFISIAEHSGQIVDIGQWVMSTACEQLARWRELSGQTLRLHMNFSVSQFADAALPATLAGLLEKHGFRGEDLVIEIDESQIQACADDYVNVLLALRKMQIAIALDNYGAGSAALSHLHKMPVNLIKIDKSLVRDCARGDRARAVVRSIIKLAKELNMEVVAEGVESIKELNLLCELGNRVSQGIFLAPPLRPDDCTAIWGQGQKQAGQRKLSEIIGL